MNAEWYLWIFDLSFWHLTISRETLHFVTSDGWTEIRKTCSRCVVESSVNTTRISILACLSDCRFTMPRNMHLALYRHLYNFCVKHINHLAHSHSNHFAFVHSVLFCFSTFESKQTRLHKTHTFTQQNIFDSKNIKWRHSTNFDLYGQPLS